MTLRFLVDADLPRTCVDVIKKHGSDAIHVDDVRLGTASDAEIAEHAKANGYALVTGDFGFGDIRNYPPAQYAGIVVFQFPNTWTAAEIVGLVDSFFAQRDVVDSIGGKLAIVEERRVRLRG